VVPVAIPAALTAAFINAYTIPARAVTAALAAAQIYAHKGLANAALHLKTSFSRKLVKADCRLKDVFRADFEIRLGGIFQAGGLIEQPPGVFSESFFAGA
jgi:hypothetical protein